jgi:hypothetical protein
MSDAREQFQQLLDDHGITQAQSAALICHQTQRPCSVRTVRSWLNDPDKPSSRPCPEWAVKALEKALRRSEKATKQQGA